MSYQVDGHFPTEPPDLAWILQLSCSWLLDYHYRLIQEFGLCGMSRAFLIWPPPCRMNLKIIDFKIINISSFLVTVNFAGCAWYVWSGLAFQWQFKSSSVIQMDGTTAKLFSFVNSTKFLEHKFRHNTCRVKIWKWRW